MALAKATTNKKHCTDLQAFDPVYSAPNRQTNFYKPRLSMQRFLSRLTLYNPLSLLIAGRFYPRVPFITRKLQALMLDSSGILRHNTNT
jgi:hypothetical protein